MSSKDIGPGRKELNSEPPSGKRKVTNIWWDPDSNEIVVEHE